MTSDHRIDRLEESINELRREMNARFNVHMQITVGLWAATMLGVLATLAAVLFKG